MASTRVFASVIAPLAVVAALIASTPPAAAQSDPVVGSSNVATAEPPIPLPPSTPCTVTLFENQQFADFNTKPFDFEPPAACPGPWQKVVLSADYSVTPGRQFDRTAQIWLGGAIIYFGTTQEPQATQVTTSVNGSDTSANVTSNRQFSISGTLNTSHGTVNTQVAQTLSFSNAQHFTITDSVYHQHVVQSTTIDSTTTTTNGRTTSIVHEQRGYPFVFDYDQEPAAGGRSTLVSTIDQEFKQSVSVGFQGFASRSANRDNHVVATDTFDLGVNGNISGHHGQATTQTYTYNAPFGACYSRTIAAAGGVLTTLTDGAGCPGGNNQLYWFDAFHNYGSAVAGNTLQLLP